MTARYALFFLVFASLAFAQAGHATEGGNISQVDVARQYNSSWHGVVGQTSNLPYVPPFTMVNATPSNITYIPGQKTGAAKCAHGIDVLNLLFSNSSTEITSLSRGNLPALDSFIGDREDNGSATLVFSTSFETAGYGTITGVPTTYTNAPNPTIFRMGYLQDQDGNIVFITPVVSDKAGYNGSLFDFQLMLPTMNSTLTLYYVTADLECAPPPRPPEVPPEGGGGTKIPYYNETRPPEPPPVPPPTPPPEVECIPELFCGEWGPCIDGYQYQPCVDETECSDIEVYRVRKCVIPPPEVVPPPPEEIIPIIVQPEFPCLPFVLIGLLAILVFYYLIKRRKRRGGT